MKPFVFGARTAVLNLDALLLGVLNPHCGPSKACILRYGNNGATGMCVDAPSEETLKQSQKGAAVGNAFCSPQINMCLDGQSCYILPPDDVEHKMELELSSGESYTGICLNCSNEASCLRSKDCCFESGCFAFRYFNSVIGFRRII